MNIGGRGDLNANKLTAAHENAAQEDVRLRPIGGLVSATVPGTPRPGHHRGFLRAAVLPPHRYHQR